MAISLSLNCLILGDTQEHMITPEVENTKSATTLKELIKQKYAPNLNHIAATDLNLWMVNLHLDELGNDPVHVNLDTCKKLSPPRLPLSSFFKGTVDDQYLHVIVKAPVTPPALHPTQLLSLNCFFLGDDPDRMFPVEVEKTKKVGILKDRIKEKKAPHLNHIAASELDLWKVNWPIGDLPSKSLPTDPSLKPENLLLDLFSAELDHNRVHVVVRAPMKAFKESRREAGRDQITSLHKRFGNVVSDIAKATAPSEGAKSSLYAKSLVHYSICDGRYKEGKPTTAVAPPIQLFHPAFAQFLDDIRATGPISPDIIRQTTGYMRAASAIYPDEIRRQNELTPFLCDILGVNIQKIMNDDRTNADGIVELLTELGGSFMIYLQEYKNEIGDGGSDPSTQAGLSGGRYWVQPKVEMLRNATNCPTFLVAIAGPWISILGAVITDVLIVQRLTDYIWVGLDSTLCELNIFRVARTFYALKNALGNLKSYYMGVEKSSILSTEPSGARYFPSITSYTDDDNKRVHFKYVGFLENSPDCMTLRAQTLTEPSRDIVVKFADHYGAKAHRILANNNLKLAPDLLYCGSLRLEKSDPSYDSLTMIVMEFINGETLAASKMNRETAKMVKSKIKVALDELHLQGLVFGDLRSVNVMITPAKEVRLIDFNWAGEQGQAKYPCLISSEIPWPAGVKGLAVIEADHDLQMLEKIFSGSAPFITDS